MIQKDTIFAWLEKFGAKPSFGEAEGVEWIISAQFRDITFTVVRPMNDDRVVLQRGLEAGDEVLDGIIKAEKTQRIQYLYDLKKYFLTRGIRYKMFFNEEDETILNKLLLETFVYDDGLSKHNFFKEFNSLTDATYLYIVTTEHYFKERK